MRYSRFCRLVWPVLLLISLQTAASTLSPGSSSPPQSPTPLIAFAQSQPDPDDSWGEKSPFVSKDLSLQCESLNKQRLMPIGVCMRLAAVLQRENHLHSPALVPAWLLVRLFFPRKLAPPAADDEPFLSSPLVPCLRLSYGAAGVSAAL
jgi:hypothetical protein